MPRSHPLPVGVLLLVALASCNETTTEPATPPTAAASLSTTALAFYQVSSGFDHTCGVTTDNRAYCWGDNWAGQLGDGTTVYRRVMPVAVASGLRFHAISAGYGTTCGVTTDYQAYCWGYNLYGQVGDGSTNYPATPSPVAGRHQFVQVETNGKHTCGVSYPDRRAYCWGTNSYGELGDNTQTNRLTPVAVAGSLTMRQVSVGYDHTCGVATNNLAYCWGYNRYGQNGDSSHVLRRLRPSRVAGAHQFRSVDAGADHTCAVTTGDVAFCWGNGSWGQLGNGTADVSFWPRAVAGGIYFTRVTAGLLHTCGETRSNLAYCWGHNTRGQLGDGTGASHLTPVAVRGGLSFKQVSVGGFHTCGKTAASEAYCWGWNAYGQLGDGTTTNRSTPVRVAGGP